MGKDIKSDLKNMAKEAEVKLAESLLRWRHKKVHGKLPDEGQLEHDSRLITDQANRILVKRGKNILKEIKKAYQESKKQEENGG